VLFIQFLFSSHAAIASDFTLEQVMSSPFPSNLVAASHSGRVAWVFDAKGVRNLWVADAPNFGARQITRYDGDEGLPLASLRITADGRTLVYVRGSEANESGRVADPSNGVWPRKQQVWAVEVEGGAAKVREPREPELNPPPTRASAAEIASTVGSASARTMAMAWTNPRMESENGMTGRPRRRGVGNRQREVVHRRPAPNRPLSKRPPGLVSRS